MRLMLLALMTLALLTACGGGDLDPLRNFDPPDCAASPACK